MGVLMWPIRFNVETTLKSSRHLESNKNVVGFIGRSMSARSSTRRTVLCTCSTPPCSLARALDETRGGLLLVQWYRGQGFVVGQARYFFSHEGLFCESLLMS